LKACLDRAPAVAGFRSAAQAAAKARDPKTPAKFNCSGIGASWQEVAPKACCAAFERDKGKNVDAAWAALQVCGWQAKTAERRPAYETAARQCLAQTAAPSPPAPQQAQRPQAPSPQQQAQRPQPTPPVPAPQETRRPPAWPEPGWPAQQGQVPLTPPPPLAPAAPQQQAQLPLTPPPPIPPLGPVQQTQKPGDATERYLRAIEESLGVQPGLLVMAESIYGSAGYVMYVDAQDRPWVVDTFGIHKPMYDWLGQRIAGEQFVLLTDQRLRAALQRNLPFGIGNIAFIWDYDFTKGPLLAAAKKGQRSLGPRHNGYAAFRVHASDNAILSNRSLRAPAPPPGADLVLYYYLWRRALQISSTEPTATLWELAQRINGGGDFIELRPGPREAKPSLHAAGRWTGPAIAATAMPAAAETAKGYDRTRLRVELVSASADLRDFGGRVELSAAGVSVIAVTHGSATVREHATGATTTAEAGSAVAVLPGIGVAEAQMPGDLHARVAAGLKALPPVPPAIGPAADAAKAARQQLAADAPTIGAIAPARGVKDGKPVEPGAVFAPDTKELFVWFRLSGVTAPTQIRSVWNYVAPDGDQFIVESEATARPENQWGDFRVEGPAGRPWPTGQYRVDIFIAGKKAASVPFRVEDVVAHPAIVTTRAALGVKDGEPVGVSEVFAPDAGTLYAWFRIAGHTRPVKLRGEWHYLGSGGDRMVIASDLTVQPNESWGDFQFELPPGRPWPLGAYRVDIIMDGKVAASVPFRVEAAAAKPVPAKPVAEAAPKIVEAKAALGVKEGGVPVGVTEVFAPDAGRLYVWFRIAGHDRPVKLLSEWRYLGTGRDELLADIEMTGQPGKDAGHFALELLPGRLWPLGAYRVDILLDGKVAASVAFRVAAAAPKPTARPQVKVFDMLVARGIKDGKPVAPAAAFAPDASPLYVWFRVSGNTEPVKLRGEWRYLGGGQDRIIARGEGTLKAGSAWTNFRRTLAEGKTWALGDYRFDLFVDDTLASSARFRIVEGGPKPMAEAAASPKIVEAKPARDVNEDGKPVGPSDVFTPDTRQIFIWYRITGNPAPVEMHSVWRYLGGGGDSASAPEGGTQPAGREWGAFGKEREANDPWPVGEYRVDIFIGGAQAASVPFRVAAATPVAGSAGPVTFETVEALLNELGAKPRRDTRPDGVPFLAFRLDGRDTALALFGCAPGKPCARLMLHTGFRLPQPVPAETLNAWTAEHRFVRAFHDDEGDPMLESDLVAVGSRMSTVREWIAEWRKQVPQFLDRVAKKG